MKKYVVLQETTETLYNLYSLTYPSFIPFTGKIHFHSPVSLALAISTVAIQLYGSLIDIKILPPSYQLWLNSWLIEKKSIVRGRDGASFYPFAWITYYSKCLVLLYKYSIIVNVGRCIQIFRTQLLIICSNRM